MLYHYTTVTMLLLSSFLCVSMENHTSIQPFKLMSLKEFESMLPKQHMRFKADAYKRINQQFKEKWGYFIPDTIVKETIKENNTIIKSTYKLVPEGFLKEKKPNITYEIQPTWNIPLVLTVEVSTVNSCDSVETLKEKIQRKENDIISLQIHNENLKKEISRINGSIKKHQKTNTHIQNNKSNQNIVYHPGLSYNEKRCALLGLLKDYQAKTISFLLCKIKSECAMKDANSVGGCTDNNITWLYTLNNNKLTFNVSESDSSESSSD